MQKFPEVPHLVLETTQNINKLPAQQAKADIVHDNERKDTKPWRYAIGAAAAVFAVTEG